MFFFVHASHSLINVIMLLGTIRGRQTTARGPNSPRQGFFPARGALFLIAKQMYGALGAERLRSSEFDREKHN